MVGEIEVNGVALCHGLVLVVGLQGFLPLRCRNIGFHGKILFLAKRRRLKSLTRMQSLRKKVIIGTLIADLCSHALLCQSLKDVINTPGIQKNSAPKSKKNRTFKQTFAIGEMLAKHNSRSKTCSEMLQSSVVVQES